MCATLSVVTVLKIPSPSGRYAGFSCGVPISCLSNPQQATAAKYHQRMEHERKAREDAAKSIVMGLGDGLDSFDSDVLAGIADGIESVLRAPLGDNSDDNA